MFVVLGILSRSTGCGVSVINYSVIGWYFTANYYLGLIRHYLVTHHVISSRLM